MTKDNWTPPTSEEYKALPENEQYAATSKAVDMVSKNAGPAFTVTLLIAGQALARSLTAATKRGDLTEAQARVITMDYAGAFIDAYKIAADVARAVKQPTSGDDFGLNLDGSEQ